MSLTFCELGIPTPQLANPATIALLRWYKVDSSYDRLSFVDFFMQDFVTWRHVPVPVSNRVPVPVST